MKISCRSSLSLIVGMVAFIAPALDAAVNVGPARIDATHVNSAHINSGRVRAASTSPAPSQRLTLSPAGKAALGEIDDSIRDQPSPRRGVARVAIHRSITTESMAQGTWQTLGDGTRVWRIALHSTNALGLRAHFTGFNIGSGQVWIHDTNKPASKTLGPYTGGGPLGKGDFWTGTIFGDTVEIEYQAPAGSTGSSGMPPFTVAELIHIWKLGTFESPRATTRPASAAAAQPAATSTTAAALNTTCFLDATCYGNDPVVASASQSTALIFFGDYQCSATILNPPNGAALLLTAGHCVNTEQEAESLEAIFDYRTSYCGQDANAAPTYEYFNSLPYSTGKKLLAFANAGFLDGSEPSQIQNDLDYSLIELTFFPNSQDTVLAGYTTTDLNYGDKAISLSQPLGEYMKVAFGTRVAASRIDGSYFVNAYEIDQSTSGRIDSGSSGSGLYDANSNFVGLLSTGTSCPNPKADGSCPASYTACLAQAPFETFYTKFSAIYPYVAKYLNEPITAANSDPSVFYASPNPIDVTDGSGLGQTTLFFNEPSKSSVEVRVGSPSGPLFTLQGGVGQATTQKWITDGTMFYLQDGSQGDPTSSSNTLATVTVSFGTSTFAALPAALPRGTYGSTTLSWSAPNSPVVEIWIGDTEPQTLFARVGSFGTLATPNWVTPGITFFLVDGTTKRQLSNLTIQVAPPLQALIFTANPNPIVAAAGGPALGATTLQWVDPAIVKTVEVRLGSPTGPLFAELGGTGSAETGAWVTNGMTFYLQNVTNGLPLTTANTLATTSVEVVQQ